ncbi:MAG: alkaline phosphatase family protein [Actinomycetota bacterium]
MVPRQPNYWGSFGVTSHTGPWDYLQTVPLVLYGPGYINAAGTVGDASNVVDVFPTVGDLLGVTLPKRDGTLLHRALVPQRDGMPRLILVIVWDGAGRNVLDRWPRRWPHLARLEKEGTSFENATVGSSPSITAATHSNLGTGAWPRSHGMTGNRYRAESGEMSVAFDQGDPRRLRLSTFADEVDRALDNEPLVGLIGWQPGTHIAEGREAWRSDHIGMFGHGRAVSGGDADQVGLLGESGRLEANPKYYSPLSHLSNLRALAKAAGELDVADGRADGKSLGHDILTEHDNPAWAAYQTKILLRLLKLEDYGKDAIPDLLFTNYKMTDRAGHNYTLDSREMAVALEAQDAALGRLVTYLEREVRDFVVVLTADHGHTASTERTGAWPISSSELVGDLNDYFDIPENRSLVTAPTPAGLFLNRAIAKAHKVSPHEIAVFLNGYTIEENWREKEIPDGYKNKANQTVLSAAFVSDRLPAIMRCKFGSPRPPPDIGA